MKGTPSDPGPLPAFDHVGYELAIHMVVSSLGAGRYSGTHKQWEMIWRFRPCFSNQVRAAKESNSKCLVLADNTGGNYQCLALILVALYGSSGSWLRAAKGWGRTGDLTRQ